MRAAQGCAHANNQDESAALNWAIDELASVAGVREAKQSIPWTILGYQRSKQLHGLHAIADI